MDLFCNIILVHSHAIWYVLYCCILQWYAVATQLFRLPYHVSNCYLYILQCHSRKSTRRARKYTAIKLEIVIKYTYEEKKNWKHIQDTHQAIVSHTHTVHKHILISRWHIFHEKRKISSNFGWLTDEVVLWWHPAQYLCFTFLDLKHLCLARQCIRRTCFNINFNVFASFHLDFIFIPSSSWYSFCFLSVWFSGDANTL